MTERTALRITAGIAFVVSIAVLVGVLSLAAYALNRAGFAPRVTPAEAYDGPPLK
jgi:hypothetical protein